MHRTPRTAKFRCADTTPLKLRGCFGQLTPGQNLELGSSIGQIPSVQPARTNLLPNSAIPVVVGGSWTQTGTGTITNDPTDQYDAGFLPQIVKSLAGASDFVTTPAAVIAAATQYTISAEFSVSPVFVAGFATAASVQAKLEIRFAGGSAAVESITFNTVTGQLISNTSGVTAASTDFFSTITATGATAQILRVQFTVTEDGSGNTSATLRVYPQSIGTTAAGSVEAGAFQIEAAASASAYVATGFGLTATRALGITPRQDTDLRRVQQVWSTNASYDYQFGIDSNTSISITGVGGSINIGAPTAGTASQHNGECITVINAKAGSTCQVTGANGLLIYGPGFSAAGVASFLIPTSTTYPKASVTMMFDGITVPNRWILIDNNIGLFTSGGVVPGPASVGATGTILRSDGTNWVASQDTWPDLVASGNVLYATAANTVGSGAEVNYNGAIFKVAKSVSGADLVLLVNNTSAASATARAVLQASTVSGGGDALMRLEAGTVAQSWSAGIDVSASDAFVIAASGTLGTTNTISISTAGVVSVLNSLNPLALLDISAAGAGQIQFPATQNASANANTLDDYEEGTFTPTIVLGGGSVTYTTQNGEYTKTGRGVIAELFISVNVATTPSGALQIGGLPFAANATTKGALSILPAAWAATAVTSIVGKNDMSATTLSIFRYAAGAIANCGGDIANGCGINITTVYQT